MSNILKDARRDAAEFAAAQMAYGEGAGTRRKLIESAVAYKMERIPSYRGAFEKALESQDITKHIRNAKRNRAVKDIGAVTSQNVRAIARNDRGSMSTPVIALVIAFGVAHQTGYDKKIWAYTKRKTTDVRAWLKRKL